MSPESLNELAICFGLAFFLTIIGGIALGIYEEKQRDKRRKTNEYKRKN